MSLSEQSSIRIWMFLGRTLPNMDYPWIARGSDILSLDEDSLGCGSEHQDARGRGYQIGLRVPRDLLMTPNYWDTQDVRLLWDIRLSIHQRFNAIPGVLILSKYWDTQDVTLLQDIGMSGYWDTHDLEITGIVRIPSGSEFSFG